MSFVKHAHVQDHPAKEGSLETAKQYSTRYKPTEALHRTHTGRYDSPRHRYYRYISPTPDILKKPIRRDVHCYVKRVEDRESGIETCSVEMSILF